MTNTTIILIIGTLLTSIGCTKNNPSPDPEPVYYVKCLLNGEPWMNCCDDCNDQWGWGSNRTIYSQYYSNDKHLEISVGNDCGLDNGFLVASDSLELFKKRPLFKASYYNDHSLDRSCQQFELWSSLSNYMQLDSIEPESVYGAFKATFTNSCGDTVRLTEGEFHVIR